MKSLVPWKKKEERSLAGRSDPFAVLHREIDDLFDQFSNGFLDDFRWPGAGKGTGVPAMREPSIDFTETDDSYQLSADLPGVEEKDLDVAVDGDMLTIRAEHSQKEEKKEKDYHIMERRSGSYQRAIPLPADIDPENIKAKFKNGVLSLSLPKNPELASKKRAIEIES